MTGKGHISLPTVPLAQVAEQFRKYKPEVAVRNLAYNWLNRERRLSWGEPGADGTVYVIRSLDDTSRLYIGPRHNLLANYFYVLSHLAYAREQGWRPVVDQQNYPVYNSVAEPVNGTGNAWEYFWEQPAGLTLDQAYNSGDIVLSKRNWYGQWDMGYDPERYSDRDTILFYGALADQVPLNPATAEYCRQMREELFSPGLKVMGVSVRVGGHASFAYLQASGHPIQGDNAQMLEICRRKFDDWGMDRVFLATDSDGAVSAFGREFGDRLTVMPRQRCAKGCESSRDRLKPMYLPDNIYQTSLDYLAEMELLAACDALVGSVSSGLRYAVIRNRARYEHVDILDFGRFRDERMKNSWEGRK